MNQPRCKDLDYIHFLIASLDVFTCTEAARCQPFGENSPSHDAFTRLLQRQPPDTDALWNEVNCIVQPENGFLIADDTLLDKPYAKKMDLVYHQWSGKQHRIVNGINVSTLLWTDGSAMIPVDFRIYDVKSDGKTKNDHFQDMLHRAKERGFKPSFVLFDSWYSSIDNLKIIRKYGWHWLTRLKKNRLVNPNNTKNIQIQDVKIPPEGIIVHLKAYGFIKVFKRGFLFTRICRRIVSFCYFRDAYFVRIIHFLNHFSMASASLNDSGIFQCAELIQVKSKSGNHHNNGNSSDCCCQYPSRPKYSFYYSMRSLSRRS